MVVAVAIVVPLVLMLEPPPRTSPVAGVIPPILPARPHPRHTLIGNARPVSFVPAVVPANRVPVAVYPRELGTRRRRPNSDDTWGRRAADHDPHRDVRAEQRRGGEQQCSQQ